MDFTACVLIGIALGTPEKLSLTYMYVPYGFVAHLTMASELERLARYPGGQVQVLDQTRPDVVTPLECQPYYHLYANWAGGVW